MPTLLRPRRPARRRAVPLLAAAALTVGLAACQSSQTGGGEDDFEPVHGGTIDLVISPATAAAWSAAGVTVSPQSPATTVAGTDLRFPVGGGTVRDGSLVGAIDGNGAFQLTATNGSTVTISDPRVSNAVLTGVVDDVRRQVVTGSVPIPAQAGNQVYQPGSQVTLSSELATDLNHDLGVSVFTNTVIGTVSVQVTTARGLPPGSTGG